MGLDITAYSRLEYVGKHEIDPESNEGEEGPWCYKEDHVQAFAYDSFPQSFRGIPVLGTRDAAGFIEGGCYAITPETQQHGFRAGSYGGYNQWRADLQQQFNPGRDPQGPFYELIWFADNEGSIGPEAAKDLLDDFRAHADQYALAHGGIDHEWFRVKYADWTRAFLLAADCGLVSFH